jgi:hypothetical protein
LHGSRARLTFPSRAMNPDKLFDYLDGKLVPAERQQLEEQLMADEQLRRQFNIAREIHRAGGSREVIVPEDPERGGRLGRRIAVAAIILVFLNVVGGLSFITFKKAKSSESARGEDSAQRQVAPLVNAAAEKAMPLPTFVPAEIEISAPRAEWESVAGRVIAAATLFGGDARIALPEENRLTVLADIPTSREAEFRRALTAPFETSSPAGGEPTATPPSPNERTIVQVRIVEAGR